MVDQKLDTLRTIIKDLDRVVVAFSGGVDSTFLLKVAVEVLGTDRVLAVTADSETYPSSELLEAKRLAEELNVHHRVIETSELAIPGYAENTQNRCYFCKKSLFEHLLPIMKDQGYQNVVYGLIADDMSEHRPGTRAAQEMGVRAPLQEAGLYKEEIRALSRELGLSTWNKPSFACLSSRIAYGEHITMEKLTKIDQSESYLKRLGLGQVRVRTHGEIARIEVEPKEMPLVLQHHQDIVEKLRSFGYTYVTLDLLGYKSGSMNQVLVGLSS
ncbi:ATP-dependent sacrificial sulfur transferase LarE [Brevibacillus ruminantium]|uniref:ATP-dependent sacrificial sulfur transferase LarE n=1 Tax=Brevibacillus ruminantium TaxID=2950604 RepID=A0ABY4WMU8_9BACL|nr:ATP-dependent sacrificial sulfur transferase LarE [Brevibacillus ruminantium]USG68503.1 ATP-dependent sacrificial sulfur transferase LarE [Brevibacillus ruminantium]